METKDKLVCPYCGETQYGHEPDDISSEYVWTQCEYCDKHFWYDVTVTREYYIKKLDKE